MSFVVIACINDQLFKVITAFSLLILPNSVKNCFILYSNSCIFSDIIYYKSCNCSESSNLLLLSLLLFGVPSNFSIKPQKSSFNAFATNCQYAFFFSLSVYSINQHLSRLQTKHFFVQSSVISLRFVKRLAKRLRKRLTK